MDRGTPGRPAGGNEEAVTPTDDIAAAADDAAPEDNAQPAPEPVASPRDGPPAHWLAYIRARAPWLLAPGGRLATTDDGVLGTAGRATEPDVIPHGPTAHVEGLPGVPPLSPSTTAARGAPAPPASDPGTPAPVAFVVDEPGPGRTSERAAAPQELAGSSRAEAPDLGDAGSAPPRDHRGSSVDDDGPSWPDPASQEPGRATSIAPDVARPPLATDDSSGAAPTAPWPGVEARDPVASRPTTPEPEVPRPTVSEPAWPGLLDASTPASRPRPAPWDRASADPSPPTHTDDTPTPLGVESSAPQAPPPASLPWPIAPGSASVSSSRWTARTEGWRVAATPPDTTTVARLALPAWPALPDDPPEDDPDRRSIERRLERTARLDREQRRR